MCNYTCSGKSLFLHMNKCIQPLRGRWEWEPQISNILSAIIPPKVTVRRRRWRVEVGNLEQQKETFSLMTLCQPQNMQQGVHGVSNYRGGVNQHLGPVILSVSAATCTWHGGLQCNCRKEGTRVISAGRGWHQQTFLVKHWWGAVSK